MDDKVRYTDWDRRDNIKTGLLILLAGHCYPPGGPG